MGTNGHAGEEYFREKRLLLKDLLFDLHFESLAYRIAFVELLGDATEEYESILKLMRMSLHKFDDIVEHVGPVLHTTDHCYECCGGGDFTNGGQIKRWEGELRE